MLAIIPSATLLGVHGQPVSVEVHVSAGLPGAGGSRYILVTPAQGGPGQGGAMICDTSGRLVWFSPASSARSASSRIG